MTNYNKSEICKKANELIKDGYTRAEAFKAAWEMAKGIAMVGSSIAAKARSFKEIQRMIEELEAQANGIRESIIAEMDGAEEITADVFRIRYITVISNRLDTANFKKDHADLYNEYLKECASKRFTVAA